jgi:Lhr-like helicase
MTPLTAGSDAVLLAPTAGGKTEAAMFPLLSAMSDQKWSGVSLIYVCPIKALLNNPCSRRNLGWPMVTRASRMGRPSCCRSPVCWVPCCRPCAGRTDQGSGPVRYQ